MPKRTIAWTIRVFRAAAAIAVVAAIIVAARLTHGPIDLAPFKPTIESALTEAIPGADVKARRLMLNAGDGRLSVGAFGVTVTGPDGETMMRASRVDVAMDATELLQGRLRPSSLDVLNARLTATRAPDGAISLLASGDGETDEETAAMDLAVLLRTWLSGEGKIRDLPNIRLSSATLTAQDGETGEVLWRGWADAGATLAPDRALFWAEIGSRSPEERTTPAIRMSATLARQEGGDVALTFDQADLGSLALVARLFDADAPAMQGKVDGSASARVDMRLEPVGADVALSGKGISIEFESGRHVAIDQIALEAQGDAATRTITISGVRLGPNGGGLVGAGTLRPVTANARSGMRKFSGRIDHADVAYLADIFGAEAALKGLEAALTVDFDIELDDRRIGRSEARIVADGRIDRDDVFYQPIAIERAEGFVVFRPDVRTVSLKGFDAISGDFHIAGEAVAGFDPQWALDTLNGKVLTGAFPIKRLPEIWPKAFSPGGRAWVEQNLSKGQIKGADIVLAKRPGGAIEASGAFSADGMDIRYWDAMPLATGVSGTGSLAGDVLTMSIDSGASGGLHTRGVTVVLSDLGQSRENIDIRGSVVGPARNLLNALDREPLGYAKWLGISPDSVEGRIDGEIRLAFPLIDDLSVDDLDISASGRATDAVLPGAVRGWTLVADKMDIAVDANQLNVDGAGKLLDQPLTFAGDINFGRGEKRARLKGTWRLTRDVRRHLGLGAETVRRRIAGVTPAAFDVVVKRGNLYEIGIDANLQDATLLAQEIGWLKPKGAPARIKAVAVIKDDLPLRIDGIELTAGDLALRADVVFDPADGSLKRVSVGRLFGAGHDLSGEVVVDPEADRVRIYGRKADLRPLLQLNRGAAAEAPPDRDGRPKHFDIDLGEARLSDSLFLERVRATFSYVDHWPKAIRAEAVYPGGTLSLNEKEPSASGLRLEVSNLGGLLAGAGITEGVVGGAGAVDIEKNQEEGLRLEAHFGAFEFTRAELERLAGGGSGFVSMLGGRNAVRFDDLDIFSRLADGVLTIDKGRAAGAMIGMSARGEVDFRRREIDIYGAIAPAYVISRVIGQIPIIGDLLTGLRNEGVFAANYRASGSLDDPDFNIDQLSAFAPGILREALRPAAPSQERPESQPDQR